MTATSRVFFIALSVLFARSRVDAQSLFEGARLLGAAEAQRALSTGNDSIYLNPAGLALGSQYSVELGYLDDARGSDRRLNASIVDSQAGPIAGGIAYTYMKKRPDDIADGDERIEGHRVELSLATPVHEGISLGATIRYLNFDRKIGEEAIPDSVLKLFTFDVGVQWRVAGGLSLGVVGYNLTNSERVEVPISWGAGIGYALDALTFEADVRYNAQRGKAMYSGSAGYVIAETLPIRAGLSYDLATESFAFSVGAGVILDRFSIDIGFRQRLKKDGMTDRDEARILGVALRGQFL